MRISDWSSDVCSSDLINAVVCNIRDFDAFLCCQPDGNGVHAYARTGNDLAPLHAADHLFRELRIAVKHCIGIAQQLLEFFRAFTQAVYDLGRSEEHTSELQSLMRKSYAVFCMKKKKK